MKEKTTIPAFSFQSHKIPEFTYTTPAVDQSSIAVLFAPSGVYTPKTGIFKLDVEFKATYGEPDSTTFSTIKIEGYFKFEPNTPLEKFPEYFYANSIAILYPYLRAFLTTLTSVANVKPLILPTLNLQDLANPLKENIEIV